MKKDFDAIKEMANKKLLNFEQKKVLCALFESKINTKESDTDTKQTEELSRAEKNVLAEISNRAEIKKAMATIDKAEQEIKDSEKLLSKNSVRYETEGYNGNVKKLKLVGGSYGYDEVYPKVLKELKKQHKKKIEDIRELKLKLKSDIYALPMAYNEINDYIDNELARI